MKSKKRNLPEKITEWIVVIRLALKSFYPFFFSVFTGDLSNAAAYGFLLGLFSLKDIIKAFKDNNSK